MVIQYNYMDHIMNACVKRHHLSNVLLCWGKHKEQGFYLWGMFLEKRSGE